MAQKVIADSITEAIAAKPEVVGNSLNKLLDQLREEKGIEILEETMEEAVEVENPPEGVDEAYSQHMELRIEFQSFSHVFAYVMKYGPSVLEIVEPSKYEMGMDEGQQLVNRLMAFMHQFAQAGAGGIVVAGQN